MALDRLTIITSSGLSTVSDYVIDGLRAVGVVTASTVQVGAATTVHTTGLDLGSGNITSHNINSTGIITATGIDVKGVLSYEDVTNIDSVGVITARSGINVTGGSVGIGTFNQNAKLALNPLTTIPNIVGTYSNGAYDQDPSYRHSTGGVSIANTENKTYPTDPNFVVNLGLNQNIEVGGTQTINPTTPSGYNFISGIRNFLRKEKGNTQDIERSYYIGINNRFIWNDENTCKQHQGINDNFDYYGKDANGRISSTFIAKNVTLWPPDGGVQTIQHSVISDGSLTIGGSAGITTVNVNRAVGVAPNLALRKFAAGTHDINITDYRVFATSRYWGMQGSGGISTCNITNYYGLKLEEPQYGPEDIVVTNNYGVYSGWSESKNYFAGLVGIGSDNPTAKLDVDGTLNVSGVSTFSDNVSIASTNVAALTITPPSNFPVDNPIGGVSIANTENKTYPTTSSNLFLGLGLNQNIEVGGTQVINPSTPGGYKYISGIRNILSKTNGNTQDIERSYYYGTDQRFTWNDQNTCKQYTGVNDIFIYAGTDANGRTSNSFNADSLILLPSEGGQQTIASVNSKNTQLRGNGAAGISTVAITDATGYRPNLTFMNFNLGTHNNSITNYSAFRTNQYWGTQGSLGTLNATITNYYGLHLTAPYNSTGLTITNNYGVYSGWSESKNYFAGLVGIGTDNPQTALEIGKGHTDPVIRLNDPDNRRMSIRGPSANNFASVGTETSHALIFFTNGYSNERLRITSSGEVNVGGSDVTQTGYVFQVSKDLGTPSASGTGLARFKNANSTYSQDLNLLFNNSKDIIWTGGSGNGGMTWKMGTRGYNWEIGGVNKFGVGSSNATLNGTTDGVLNINTTDGRGSFIRLQENGTTKVWVGSGEGMGVGDQDDACLMSVDNIYFRNSTDSYTTLQVSKEGRLSGNKRYPDASGTLRSNPYYPPTNQYQTYSAPSGGQKWLRFGYFSSRGKYRITFNSTGGYYSPGSTTFDFQLTWSSPHAYVGNIVELGPQYVSKFRVTSNSSGSSYYGEVYVSINGNQTGSHIHCTAQVIGTADREFNLYNYGYDLSTLTYTSGDFNI